MTTDRARLTRMVFGLVAVVGVLGMAIAMLMATSFWWWDQSASALGTDLVGGFYFNVTMVLLGIAFVPVAIVMDGLLRDATRAGITRAWWGITARVGMFVIAVALALVGIYRIDEGDRANTIHNVSGFAVPLIVMGLMLTVGVGTDRTFPRFERRSLVILGAIVAMFVLSVTGIMSYALMEMVSFVICWWWLLVFAGRLLRRLGGAPEPAASSG